MTITEPPAVTFDVFILCAPLDCDAFVFDLVSNLERRGYSVFFPDIDLFPRSHRYRVVMRGVAESRLSVTIMGPAFASHAWSAVEMDALGQTETLPVWHGTVPPAG